MAFGIEIDQDACTEHQLERPSMCTRCGTCYEVCPSECFGEPEGGKVKIIDDMRDDCVGCRACETQCPEEAITITED